jgi:hypothetical protein
MILDSSLRGYNSIGHPERIDNHKQIADRLYTQGGCLPESKARWRRNPLGFQAKSRGRGQEFVRINLPNCMSVNGKKKMDTNTF